MDKKMVDDKIVEIIEYQDGISVDSPETWWALMERRFRLKYADRCVTCRWYGGVGLTLVHLARWWTGFCYRRSARTVLLFTPILFVGAKALLALGWLIGRLPCIGRCKREEERKD